MKIKELREFLTQIPAEFDEYELVNGEAGYVNPEDLDSLVYRLDKPIIAMLVDDATNELCFLHQTQEDVQKMIDDDNSANPQI